MTTTATTAMTTTAASTIVNRNKCEIRTENLIMVHVEPVGWCESIPAFNPYYPVLGQLYQVNSFGVDRRRFSDFTRDTMLAKVESRGDAAPRADDIFMSGEDVSDVRKT